jgi:hypothetical protein
VTPLRGKAEVIPIENVQEALAFMQRFIDGLEAERDRYKEAIEIALPALEGYLQGESGLPFTDPYRAARTAAEALHVALTGRTT